MGIETLCLGTNTWPDLYLGVGYFYFFNANLMAITPAGPADADGQTCFYCGEATANPAIFWFGTQELYLHPTCCLSLCIALLRDVHEIKQRTKEGL